MVRLNELKINYWFKGLCKIFFDFFAEKTIKRILWFLFGSSSLVAILFNSEKLGIGMFNCQTYPHINCIFQFVLAVVITSIIVIVGLFLLGFITLLFVYIFYLFIKPWVLAYSYEPLLKILREREGIKSPDSDREIKQKQLNMKKILKTYGESIDKDVN